MVSLFSWDFPNSESETFSFFCGFTEPQLPKLHFGGETRRKERDREERLWSYEEDATMFSELVPETGHQKDLDFMPQVSLWDPLPQPSVCEVTHGGPTPTRLSYFLVARPQKPQAGQAWCGWEKASCRAAAGSVFTFRRLMGAGVAIGMHLEIYQPEAFKYSLCVLPRPFFSLAHPSITSALCAAGPEASIAISCPHLVEMK